MTTPKTHYTQQASTLHARPRRGGAMLDIRAGGFVTRAMVDETLQGFSAHGDARPGPDGILVDLREVAGYESECVSVANAWLRQARTQGVRKIAFVGSSAVLRTATQVISEHSGIDLRLFDHEPTARQWLSHDATC
jgi:hypothetical protein